MAQSGSTRRRSSAPFLVFLVTWPCSDALVRPKDEDDGKHARVLWQLGDMRVDVAHSYPLIAGNQTSYDAGANGDSMAALNVHALGTASNAGLAAAGATEASTGVRGACAQEVLPHRRIMLFTLVPPYHGSTALEGVLMSSQHLATLCSAGTWQCEGRSLMTDEGFDNVGSWDYRKMLAIYGRYWNLSRPVFLEKTPQQYSCVRKERTMLLQSQLPPIFMENDIDSLKLAYVLMWRPPCLAELSSHVRTLNVTWAQVELSQLEKLVDAHQYLMEADAPVLVINFASLIWYPLLTMQRLEVFLPCLGTLDPDFVPQIGFDIMDANEWKAQGSVRDFGTSVNPTTCRYNVIKNSCPEIYDEPGFSELTPGEQARAAAAVKYLSSYS